MARYSLEPQQQDNIVIKLEVGMRYQRRTYIYRTFIHGKYLAKECDLKLLRLKRKGTQHSNSCIYAFNWPLYAVYHVPAVRNSIRLSHERERASKQASVIESLSMFLYMFKRFTIHPFMWHHLHELLYCTLLS